MADIKTRDMVKGTIKTIDKAAVAADRMRSAYIQTKEKGEHSTHAQENSEEWFVVPFTDDCFGFFVCRLYISDMQRRSEDATSGLEQNERIYCSDSK